MLQDLATPTGELGTDVQLVPAHAVGQPCMPKGVLVTLFRACELCRHSTMCVGQLVCDSPAARLSGSPESLEVARSVCGSCGPNARHLDMTTWR